ncbi:MAG: DUF1343 domain-containing protein [Polyangiaceae bacterium]
MEFGIDRVASLVPRLRGKRFGLLAHPASVDARLSHISSVLRREGLRPEIIFGPEHGYGGEAQDMISVTDARDRDGIVVRSLYGAEESALSPNPEDIRGLDAIVVDLQDVGARYYTFIWTAVLVLRVASKLGVPLIVLDRPNPLGGTVIEGRLPEAPLYHSFVGLEPMPIRHGLTLGEVVRWRAREEKLPPESVEVVEVLGWQRDAEAPSCDRPFVMPSPNMPDYLTARVYPGACLLEGTNLSEGRGTTRPFELVGAPWLDGERLAGELMKTGLPGFTARPVSFRPMFQKHGGRDCGGIYVHVTDGRFRSVATYAALIACAYSQNREHFRFRTERYEFRDDVPALDLLCGGPHVREAIVRGDSPREVAEYLSQVSPNGEKFTKDYWGSALLYPPSA